MAVACSILIILLVLTAARPVLEDMEKTAACIKVLLVEETMVKNTSNKTLNISSMPELLYFDYPQKAGWQHILKIEVYWNSTPANYSLERSSDGDYSLRVRPLQLYVKPGGILNITVGYLILLNSSGRIGWQPPINPTNALNVTGLWNYSNPLVWEAYRALSSGTGTNKTEYLYRILSWLDKNVAYRSRVPARHPWEVLEERMGDCDDRSNLLVSLLRADGIPAYTEFGFLVIPGYVLEGSAAGGHFVYRVVNGGPHAWVRAYINGRWIPIDSTFYFNSTGLPSDHIVYSAYRIVKIPLIITGWTLHTDYVESDASTLNSMENSGILVNDTVEAHIVGTGCRGSGSS